MDYLTHYYATGSVPLRSLTALPDAEAIHLMESFYEDNPVAERFKEPQEYLQNRKQVERWVRNEFIAKGGQPREDYPLYAVLGYANWIEQNLSALEIERIQIPLSIFSEQDISFTYPDSMVTHWLGMDKEADYYEPDYHGQVLTLSEIDLLMDKFRTIQLKGITVLAEGLGPYIDYVEAQIWNPEPLKEYLEKLTAEPPNPAIR